MYNFHHEFGNLKPGDFFFGRSLLREFKKIEPKVIDMVKINVEQNANLSVISDAADTEIYVIEKHYIHMMPFMIRVIFPDFFKKINNF